MKKRILPLLLTLALVLGLLPAGASAASSQISLSAAQVNLVCGQSSEVRVNVDHSGDCVVSWSSSNGKIAVCEWGNSSNSQVPLIVCGRGAGSATITVRLLDAAGSQELARQTLYVTVSCTPAVTTAGGTGVLSVGQSEVRTVTAAMNGLQKVDAVVDNGAVCSVQWGTASLAANGQMTAPLTITGKAAGSTNVRLQAFDYNGTVIATTQTIPVTVKSPEPSQITLDKDAVTLDTGETAAVHASCQWNGGVKAVFTVRDPNICAALWNKTDDTHWTLNILGKAAGTTSIVVQMLDSGGRVLTEQQLNVTVRLAQHDTEPLRLTVAPQTLTLDPAGSGSLTASWTGDTSKIHSVCVDYDASIIAPSWGVKGAASRELTLLPKATGRTTLTVRLLGAGGTVLAQGKTDITVRETKPTLSLTPESLTVGYGQEVPVSFVITSNTPERIYIQPSQNLTVDVSDLAIRAGVSTNTMRITGNAAGRGVCRVTVIDQQGQSAEAEVEVTVTGDGDPEQEHPMGAVLTPSFPPVTPSFVPSAKWSQMTDAVTGGTVPGPSPVPGPILPGASASGVAEFGGASGSVGTSSGTPLSAAPGGVDAAQGSIRMTATSSTTPTPPPAVTPSLTFVDVPAGEWFADSVSWAVARGITNGTGNGAFSPNTVCSVSEILTFLWRASGQPEPTISNPYTDVSQDAFYYKPALWAYERGMVSSRVFAPTTPCTRSMTVTYIWQASGSPLSATPVSFRDVPTGSAYLPAVAWAVSEGITTGTGDGTTFTPGTTCSRAEITTFLFRAFGTQ